MISVVKYSGTFAYIKPWTAVRDSETFSQQFLTPSMLEGIEKKLFPELLEEFGINRITRHRLSYQALDIQQEKTWSKGGFKAKKEKGVWKGNFGIINRGIMINPVLYLAFGSSDYAERAYEQTICLARNEDLLFPIAITTMGIEEFDNIDGFELIFDAKNMFKVGYNRFNESEPMFGELKVYGNSVRIKDENEF